MCWENGKGENCVPLGDGIRMLLLQQVTNESRKSYKKFKDLKLSWRGERQTEIELI